MKRLVAEELMTEMKTRDLISFYFALLIIKSRVCANRSDSRTIL